MGMNNRQFTDKENAKKLFKTFNEVYRTGKPTKEFDWQIIRKDGTKRYIEVSVSLQKNSSGKPIGFRGVARDITERKQAEEALRLSELRYRELFDNISSGVAIYEVKDNGNDFIFKDFNKAGERLDGDRKEDIIGKSIYQVRPGIKEFGLLNVFKRVWETNIPENYPASFYSDNTLKKWFENYVYKLPSGEIVAVYDDITERKRMEEELLESERRYRLIAENSADQISIMDMNLHFTYISPAIMRLRGLTVDEAMEQTLQQVLTPESLRLGLTVFEEEMQLEVGGTGDPDRIRILELEEYKKDGSIIWVEVSFTFLRNKDSKPVEILMVSRDVTERKQMEKVLQTSEEKYRSIIENIQEGCFENDLAGNFTFVNDAVCRLTGYSREELVGKSNRQYIDEKSAKKIYQIYNKIYRTGEPVKGIEEEYIRKDGIKGFAELSVSLIRDTEGKPIGFRGISHDITERKQAEVALRNSEANYRQLFDNSPAGIYQINFRTGKFLKANDLICEYLGCSQKEITSLTPYDFLTKESQILFLERLSKMAIGDKVPQDPEYEFVDKNGKHRWLKLNVKNIYDSEGLAGADVVAHDISERRQVESQREAALEALRLSEEKYRMVVENAKEAIIIIQDLKLVFVNRAAVDMIGYSGDISKSKPFTDFVHPDDLNMVSDHYIRRIKGEEVPPVYSFRVVSQDGTVKWVELNAVVIQWEGKPAALNFLNDITERKQAEEERKKSFERMRKALGATVQSISITVEMKDPYTSGHQRRVSDLARSMATEMGLSADRQDFIRTASSIHDIGKISIPSEILSKPTKLTELEFNLIKTHCPVRLRYPERHRIPLAGGRCRPSAS